MQRNRNGNAGLILPAISLLTLATLSISPHLFHPYLLSLDLAGHYHPLVVPTLAAVPTVTLLAGLALRSQREEVSIRLGAATVLIFAALSILQYLLGFPGPVDIPGGFLTTVALLGILLTGTFFSLALLLRGRSRAGSVVATIIAILLIVATARASVGLHAMSAPGDALHITNHDDTAHEVTLTFIDETETTVKTVSIALGPSEERHIDVDLPWRRHYILVVTTGGKTYRKEEWRRGNPLIRSELVGVEVDLKPSVEGEGPEVEVYWSGSIV